MTIGILLENCVGVELIGNRFHNIDQPVVARRVSGLTATGNVATYGMLSERPQLQSTRVLGIGGFPLHTLTVAIWRIYRA
jgi:hypothetical protein